MNIVNALIKLRDDLKEWVTNNIRALESAMPTKTSELTNDSNFISSIPSEYVTDDELEAKGYLTEHQDISGKADKTELPTKVSELENDSNFISSIPSEYVTEDELEGLARKGQGIYYIVGNSTGTEGEWTGSHPDLTEYYEGMIIAYQKLIAGGESSTYLNINGLGRVPVYKNRLTAMKDEYLIGCTLFLVYSLYNNKYAFRIADLDTTTNTRNSLGNSELADTKLYLAGSKEVGTSSSAYATSYVNSNVYIGADNALYSNGEKVAVDSDIPTKTSELTNDSNFLMEEDLGYITPQMFGAKADGVTDDSEAILQAVAALPKDGGVLYFPPGTYIHGDGTTTGLSYQQNMDYPEGHAYYPAVLMQNKGVDDKIGRKIRIDLDGYTNLKILGYGAILQSHENNGECSNNGMFQISNCDNVTIEGITLDGKRHERGIRFSDYSPGGYDLQRSNIEIVYCKGVVIRNVVSKNAAMDGLSFGAGSQTDYCQDILIENCKFLDNHRQGISIQGVEHMTIRDTECSLNGTGNGIMPKSGIDIEAYGDVSQYEHYSFNRDILVDKCYFDSNGYSNIVVNANSFGVTLQNCVFKNGWVVATVNNEAKLLNSRLENSNLTNGFSRVAYNTIVYNKGGYFMFSNDTSPNSETIIEHNTFDFTPTADTFASYQYNTLRLTGLETFRNNYVKNGVAITGSGHYPLWFTCKELVGNTFELTDTTFNGAQIATNVHVKGSSVEGAKVKDNQYVGMYTNKITSINNDYGTDFTITKSYNSHSLSTSSLCKLLAYDGQIRIRVVYLDQEEEILISRRVTNYCHHHVLRRNKNLEGNNLVTVYRDGDKNYYLKYTWSNTNTTIECAYAYAETEIAGLATTSWLVVSDVSTSGLTAINSVDLSVFTTTLKSNYDKAYTHSTSTHAPSNAQKNSDITKAEIEAKLTGNISSHTHDGVGDFVQNNWGSENVGKVLMVGSDGRISLYDLADFDVSAQWFTVTQNYTNVVSDFDSTKAKENLPLTITLTTTNGKKMNNKSVTVIMNEADVTSSVYSEDTNKINITSVLGNIIITAKALLYTNVADPSDPAWINGQKMDYYGNYINDDDPAIVTQIIPVNPGDTVRIKGLADPADGSLNDNIVLHVYKKNGSSYYVQSISTVNGNGFFVSGSYSLDLTNKLATFTLKSNLDIGFIKVGGNIYDPNHTAEDIIITINEEIVE